MRSSQINALLAAAAMCAIAPAQAMAQTAQQRPSQPRRRRPVVQRMQTSESEEIQAWNAAVDARKAAKKNRA